MKSSRLQNKIGILATIGLASTVAYTFISAQYKKEHAPHIVIVGGGIMGSWAAHLLSQTISQQQNLTYPYNLTLIDAGHPIRGSCGDTRALHAAIDCDLRIKMNKINVNAYLELQKQSESEGSNIRLIKKVGRIVIGAKHSMEHMYNVIQSNNIPARFIQSENDDELHQQLTGVEIRSEKTGWPHFKTLYTPFGYILKAKNILEYLREKIHNLAAIHSSITVYDDTKVIHIDRENKLIEMYNMFDEKSSFIAYDKLLITTGPWTNQTINCMKPKLPLIPIIVSNEQTQHFGFCTQNAYKKMPLITFSDSGYTSCGSDYWFMVPHCNDFINDNDNINEDKVIKVGYHRQGDLMRNDDFQISDIGVELLHDFKAKLPHSEKEMSNKQSFSLNEFILNKAKKMVAMRFVDVDTENVNRYMRCLYQNTPDKEFIVGYPVGTNDKNIVIACGFNGGGYQQAPIIAGFCIYLLMDDIYPNLVENCLKSVKCQSDCDGNVFEMMENRFNPSRDLLCKYMLTECCS